MVSIFAEGLLDEIVLRQIISKKSSLDVGIAISGKGKPYLKAKAKQLNLSARGHPIIVLADQDLATHCPIDQASEWLGETAPSKNFLLRFAVLSIESWLLADDQGISDLLEIPMKKIPIDVEALVSPKQILINLARSSRNGQIREALVPPEGGVAKVGPGYNDHLTRFASCDWDIDRAAVRSQSLRRAISRIEELSARIT